MTKRSRALMLSSSLSPSLQFFKKILYFLFLKISLSLLFHCFHIKNLNIFSSLSLWIFEWNLLVFGITEHYSFYYLYCCWLSSILLPLILMPWSTNNHKHILKGQIHQRKYQSQFTMFYYPANIYLNASMRRNLKTPPAWQKSGNRTKDVNETFGFPFQK